MYKNGFLSIGHYYKMADQKALELFLSDPERYVPPLAPNKLPAPELLPVRHVPAEVKASQEIELLGYCPVTFLDGHCRYEQCLNCEDLQ